MKILFITATRVGDAVLSTGVLDRLIHENPGAGVTVACGPAAATLFQDVPGLERVLVLDKMVFSLHWLGLLAACGGTVWDILVDLRKAPVSYLIPHHRAYRIGRSREPIHRVKKLAEALGLRDNPPAPTIWIGDALRRRSEGLIPDGLPVLAVGPTANWSAKTWRADCFRELIERLTASDGILPQGRVALFGLDDERPAILRLIDSIPEDRRIDLVGKVDLLTAGACLARAAFYVGNDSGLMHLAAATGIPTLGLFGPSPEALYAPWGAHCAVVRTDESYESIFPENFDHRHAETLMDGLSVDKAEAAARALWAQVKGDTA